MSEPEVTSITEEAAGEGAPPKKKLIKLVIVALVLLLAAGGGFYYWKMKSAAAEETAEVTEDEEKPAASKKSKKKKTAEDEESEDSSKNSSSLKAALPDDEAVKKVVELPPFIVNLADTDNVRYLRMTVNLGVGGEEGKEEKPDQLFLTRVRNAMLAILSEKSSDEILTVEGKTKLRKELLEAAQAASEEPHVEAIYITDFIVQL